MIAVVCGGLSVLSISFFCVVLHAEDLDTKAIVQKINSAETLAGVSGEGYGCDD